MYKQIKKILTSSGAVELPLLPSTTPLAESSAGNSQERKQPQPRFDLDQVTHVISDTEDFVEFSMLEKRMQDGTVHIVTVSDVEMSRAMPWGNGKVVRWICLKAHVGECDLIACMGDEELLDEAGPGVSNLVSFRTPYILAKH